MIGSLLLLFTNIYYKRIKIKFRGPSICGVDGIIGRDALFWRSYLIYLLSGALRSRACPFLPSGSDVRSMIEFGISCLSFLSARVDTDLAQ